MTSFRAAPRLMIFRSRNTEAFRARRSRRPILEAMEDRTLLSSGQLDPSFGYQGVVPLPYAADDVISYPDGRFLVSGTGAYTNGATFPYVQRYTADGQLDPTFGTLGTADDSSNVFAGNLGGFSLGLEPDGKIVQSVQYNVGAQLVRYNPDGTPDLTFGTSGSTAPLDINVNGQMSPLSAGDGGLAVLPDGRILLAGQVAGAIGLAMYRTDGTLDPSFNGNGTLVVTPGSSDDFSGLAVEDGKILVQVSDAARIDLYRFNFDGSADTTFGSSGVIELDAPNGNGLDDASLAAQQDGRIIIGYQASGSETVSRYNTDGSPDQSFGTGGSTTFGSNFNTLGEPEFSDIALQPDGKIVIKNYSITFPGGVDTFTPQLYRLNSDGTVDASFGSEGVVNLALGSTYPQFITVQPSGRIILEIGTIELAGVVGDPVVAFGAATSVSSDSGTSTAIYDVSETADSATITLERGGDLTQTLSVPFSTDDSGGQAGVNYTSVNTTVTFAVGSETATVTIPILDDPNASAPVDVPLLLGNPSDGAILGNVAAGDLHIIPVEGIVITPTELSSVMQGGAGSSFTVALQSAPTGNVTVPLSISTTNPAATLSSSTLVFTPADALTPQAVTVTAAGSSGSSPPATAVVSIGPATSTDPKYNNLAGGSATVGVYANNASSPGSIEFAAANFTVDESAGTALITVVRLGGSSGSVSVQFATSDGTFGADGKYTPLNGSISFGATVTSKTITITLIDPGYNLDGDQTVDLTLSNPTGGSQLGFLPTATLTLHDTSQLEAGDLDPAFGTDGKSILPDYLATASAVASQPDGKLVIAGTGGTASDGTQLVRVWRTEASGQPDPSFGQQGLALIPFPNFGLVTGVAIAPNGQIVVVGTATKPTGGNEFALLRLNADGSLDTSFGENGLVTTSFSPGDDSPTALFIESDESILVAGSVDTADDATSPFAFTHYGPDGSVDIGFGNGGAMVIPAVAGAVSSVIPAPGGKWLLIGGGGYDANSGDYLPGFAVRLNSDFTPDSTFGTAGIATLTWSDFYSSAALQPDGKILIGGGYAQNGLATLGRLNSDGSLDTTFGSGGSVSTVFNVPVGGDFGITSSFSSIVVEPDGRIVAIGSADDVGAIGGYFNAEARYNSDGSPDTSFADGGSRWFSIGGDGNDYGAGVVALTNGDIAIAATSDNLPVLASILTAGSQVQPTITWANPADIIYGTALSGTQLDATANVPGTFTYTPAAGTVLGAANDQTLSVSFAPADSTDYTSASDSVMINVSPANPTITWANPADIVYGTALSGTQLDATANVQGTFTYTPAAGTILQAGNNRTLSAAFTPTDTTDYTNASKTAMINVAQAKPTITWAPAAIVAEMPLGPQQLDAMASVPGTFAYSPAAGTVLHAGPDQSLSVTFTPNDAADHTSVTDIVTGITVAQAKPTITWANPADIVYGSALGATQLDATASVPGTFTYSPAAGTVLTAGSDALSVTFTPTDSADYKTVMDTTTLVVTPATPTITWASPATIGYGTPLEPDPTASVPGQFTYSPPAGTVLKAGSNTLSVIFTPTDSIDYKTVMGTITLVVTPATPSITWANPADIPIGTPLGAAQLDATASVPGSFAYSPAAGTVLTAGDNQPLSVTFTPTDATDYTSATKIVHINVTNIRTPTITWPDPASIVYGTPLGAAQLDATASVPGTFAYLPAAGTILQAGNNTLSVTFTPTDSTEYKTVTDTTTLVVTAATPTITWADPADISAGTPLGSAQLDATASVAGSFTYTPAAGTILSAGSKRVLVVSFAPTDTADYTSATASVLITVNPMVLVPPYVTGIVGITRSKKGITAITVGFDEALVRGSVVNLSLYRVLGAVTTHRKTNYTKPVRIKGISFDGTSRVTINLAKPYKGVAKVTVHGGILATSGAASSGDFSAIVNS
jgi:uncharacterized delta-60 repeat protein